MRRILIIANTYYQLILAIQMKLTIFEEDYVCLALSDHSANAENVFERLKKEKFFDECVFVRSKGVIQSRGLWQKCKEVVQMGFCKKNGYAFYLKDLRSLSFDELICYNLEVDIHGIFAILSEYNDKIQYSSYEEGMLSYNNFYYDSPKFELIKRLRKMVGKPTIFDRYEKFYCVYPELYQGSLKAVAVPPISTENKRLKSLVAGIFHIQGGVDYSRYKYIYFESVYDTEGRGIGELEFLLDFAERVGKENILVKKHPRSTVHVFEENGIAVDTNSSAPFEALQLNYDMSGCTFVSAMSGSVLSINSVVEHPSPVLMIYPMTEYAKYEDMKKFAMHVQDVIDQFQKSGKLMHISVAHTADDLPQK